jgi:hypothetical protein
MRNNHPSNFGAVSGASHNSTEPVREPEASAAMAALNTQIAVMQDKLKTLRSRLSPVLRVEPETECTANMTRAFNSPLAIMISQSTENVLDLNQQVEAILGLLEI